ncbi:polysaccharide lyase family 7 protein [Antarcticirhabdus aurantiaca]|uniref:polysaccharide lyase family 7 protein n=1 Tax=Antarcticirhabdus aurantiaca TaxID=2606717 RepID=UPI00131C45B6|nr:polysaccharide lyase family 7 protein [Antarcticirhabdus aurantiaca]
MSTDTVPSAHFDLANWKLTLPVDSKGGITGTAVEVKSLIGYENANYFFDRADGAMVFRAMAEGATTSGSKYARSELREMNGSERAAWSLAEGGTMTATLSVDAVPTRADGSAGRVVVGQIHGQDDELVRLYWEKNSVHFVNDQAGSGNAETTFLFKNAAGKAPSISLGETFSYKIDAQGDQLEVSIFADGDIYTSVSRINPVWQSDAFYFKAGVYLGVNETQGSGIGQASFHGLDFSHQDGKGLGGLTDAPPSSPPSPPRSGIHADITTRLYHATFDRAPEAAGLAFWTAAMDRGMAAADVADRFVASPEFSATYGGLTDDAFIGLLYRNVLGRNAEAAGKAYWLNVLDGPADRGDVLIGFSESPEHRHAVSALLDLT